MKINDIFDMKLVAVLPRPNTNIHSYDNLKTCIAISHKVGTRYQIKTALYNKITNEQLPKLFDTPEDALKYLNKHYFDICSLHDDRIIKQAVEKNQTIYEQNTHKNAAFVSEWQDGTVLETPCIVNTYTKEIISIQSASVNPESSLDYEYVVIDGEKYPAYEHDSVPNDIDRKTIYLY